MTNTYRAMTNQHPITSPPKLISDLLTEAADLHLPIPANLDYLVTRSVQWGADQELEACCMWITKEKSVLIAEELCIARRPKPPTLKEQALNELEQLRGNANSMGMGFDAPAIRRALEALPND
jgi:hypothetical protein